MMKILKIFVLSLLCMASLIPPCFATSEPSDSEGSEVVDTGVSLLNSGDEMPTVNISDESVQAIADAVSGAQYQYSYQYVFEGTNGITYTLDTDVAGFFDNYNVFVVTTASRAYLVWCKNTPAVYAGSDGYYSVCSPAMGGEARYMTLTANGVKSVSDLVGSANNLSELNWVTGIVWSNFTVYDYETGELLFQSDYVPTVYHTVSFVTGIDGVVVPSIEVESGRPFVLPDVSADGYSFMGWFADPEYTTLYDASSFVSTDLTLYGKFVELPPMGIFHEVLFDSLSAMLNCEPMIYILSLFGLVAIIGIGRIFVKTRF